MKSLYMRSMLALACAATLAACGGKDDGNLQLGGSVVGLTKDGLQLKNGSATLTVPKGASSFAFAELIPSESNYDVTVDKNPTGAVCTPINGKGKASNYNVTTVTISCVTNTYKLGGTISGLDATEHLTLVNAPELLAGQVNGNFAFATKVADGSVYGVSVLESSVPDKVCTVANASAAMPANDVSNVAVTCAPRVR